MMDPNGNPNSIPLIGSKPQPRFVQRPIGTIKLQDDEGIAELLPAADLTPIEALKLTQLLLWITTQPPPQQDRNGGTVLTITLWRKYMVEEQLERHFRLTLSVPLQDPGHA